MINFTLTHPFRITFTICLLLFITAGIFFGSGIISDVEASYFIVSSFFIFCGKNFSERILLLFIFFFCALCYLFMTSIQVILATEFILLFMLWKFNRKEPYIHVFCITAASFLLHLYYIQNTSIDIRQHDLSGILFYMQLITKHGINWLDFNPWHMYYLFHQPLHFIISGHIYLAEILLWQSQSLAANNLQYISLFYVTGTTILTALIFSEIKLQQHIRTAIFLIFAFNPTLTLFSGYISDDTPLLFWSCATTYFLLRWIKSYETLSLVAGAVCFSIGMLTKLSIIMLVPAISFLFLHSFCISVDKHKTVKQLSIFIIIAVPFSLLWVLRNHILFDMPFYHIPDTSPEGQNFKYLTAIERITDFTYLFKPFINAPHTVDPNIWLSMIKTELFGEWDFSLYHKEIYWPAMILYFTNIFIKLLSACGCIYLIFKKSIYLIRNNIIAYFFIIVYATIWIYALVYALEYPYTCSSDYRLFAQLILPELIIIGLMFQKFSHIFYLQAIAAGYAFLSIYIYIFGL